MLVTLNLQKKQYCKLAILPFARHVPNANVDIALIRLFRIPWLLALGAFQLPLFFLLITRKIAISFWIFQGIVGKALDEKFKRPSSIRAWGECTFFL